MVLVKGRQECDLQSDLQREHLYASLASNGNTQCANLSTISQNAAMRVFCPTNGNFHPSKLHSHVEEEFNRKVNKIGRILRICHWVSQRVIY